MNEINSKIARGAAWMVAFKFIDRAIGLASTIVLARLLLPADFGLVALAMAFIGALQLLGAFNLDIQLIQNSAAGRDQFDTAWTFNVLFSTFCGVTLVALARPVAHFYHEARLENVIYVLALGFVVIGFSNIGTVIFRREMRFDREFKFLFAKRFGSVLVTVPLALWLRNYWALVLGQLSGSVVSLALSYYASDYRPRLSLKARDELFHTSKWLLLNNFLLFLNGRAAEFFIGRLAGVAVLGLYTISAEIATLPTTEVVAPINRAAFPGYSRVADDVEQLRSSFLSVISMIALFALPAGIGIFSIADLMVPVFLGWKWQAAAPLIQVLVIYGIIQALQTNIGYVYMAVGRPRLITIIAGGQFIVLLALLVPGVLHWGAIGVAWAFLGTVILMIPVNQILIARQLDLPAKGFFEKLLRPLIAALAMAVVVHVIKIGFDPKHDTLSYFVAMMACAIAGAIVYVGVLYALWVHASRPEGSERFCFSQLENILGKLGISANLVGHAGK